MNYNILCAGCSFTKCEWLPKGNTFGGYSYSDFLPENTYNIGEPGAGITKNLIENFIQTNKGVELTHFIYQVPSPARQPKDLNDHHPDQFNLRLPMTEDRMSYFKTNGAKGRKLNHNNIWNLLVRAELISTKNIIRIFKNRHDYINKALNNIDINVKIIRERYPNVKMIFFRYETTNIPLLNEFCEGFYKSKLTDYCKDNNIIYIYEENFNTKWYKKNSLTIDSVHPNKTGHRRIADKIKECL